MTIVSDCILSITEPRIAKTSREENHSSGRAAGHCMMLGVLYVVWYCTHSSIRTAGHERIHRRIHDVYVTILQR
jgi:hypothetical protein